MSSGRSVVLRVELEDQYQERLRSEFPEVRFAVCTTDESLRASLPEAEALVGGGPLADDLLTQARALRWIQATSAGVEGYDMDALRDRRIALSTFSGIAAPNIAEHVLALILAFARGLPALLAGQAKRHWLGEAEAPPTFELGGQTLGIVGLGDIGQELAWRAADLGMRVLAVDQHAEPSRGVERVLRTEQLPELLAAVDHLALCLPLTEQTRHLIGTEQLATLRRSAYLYNVGRGEVLDQQALIVALQGGALAGAGLDVASPEPLPDDSPLWQLSNVIITSHSAAHTPKYWERGIELLIDNTRRFLAGEELRNLVDPGAGY